jgi:hypothetical protein
MTYKQFIKAIHEQAEILQAMVEESQVISMRCEMAEDDTMIMAYEEAVEEFMDNVTGLHGHVIERRA